MKLIINPLQSTWFSRIWQTWWWPTFPTRRRRGWPSLLLILSLIIPILFSSFLSRSAFFSSIPIIWMSSSLILPLIFSTLRFFILLDLLLNFNFFLSFTHSQLSLVELMAIIIQSFSKTFFGFKLNKSKSFVSLGLWVLRNPHTDYFTTVLEQFFQVLFCRTVRKITYVYCVLSYKTKSWLQSLSIQIRIIQLL